MDVPYVSDSSSNGFVGTVNSTQCCIVSTWVGEGDAQGASDNNWSQDGYVINDAGAWSHYGYTYGFWYAFFHVGGISTDNVFDQYSMDSCVNAGDNVESYLEKDVSGLNYLYWAEIDDLSSSSCSLTTGNYNMDLNYDWSYVESEAPSYHTDSGTPPQPQTAQWPYFNNYAQASASMGISADAYDSSYTAYGFDSSTVTNYGSNPTQGDSAYTPCDSDDNSYPSSWASSTTFYAMYGDSEYETTC